MNDNQRPPPQLRTNVVPFVAQVGVEENGCAFSRVQDEEDEWPLARMPVEVAAAIFRPRIHTPVNLTAPPSLSSDGSIPLGSLMENLWEVYSCRDAGDDSGSRGGDQFEPIPLQHWQAQGAQVAIDNPVPEGVDPQQEAMSLGGKDIVFGCPERQSATRCSHPGDASLAQSFRDPCVSQEGDIVSKQSNGTRGEGGVVPAADAPFITPQAILGDSASGVKRSISAASTSMDEPLQPKKKIQVLPTVMGPSAPQMAKVNRFVEFLSEKHETREEYETVRQIIEQCQAKHDRGLQTYKNLPGSVFARAIDALGAPKFQKLFAESQQRVAEKDESEHTGNREKNDIPSLLETAVGYGFHLARVHFMHDGGAASMHDLLGQGVDTVNRMSTSERKQFWKYMIESPMYHRHEFQPDINST